MEGPVERSTMPPWQSSASNLTPTSGCRTSEIFPTPTCSFDEVSLSPKDGSSSRDCMASPLDTRALLLTETALASLERTIADVAFPVYVVPQAVMNDVAGFNFHRGCLAIGVRPHARDWHELVKGARRLVTLERVGNVDNVGAIFRNAAAFGVDAVLLQADCADPLYRKAIRTSMAAPCRSRTRQCRGPTR